MQKHSSAPLIMYLSEVEVSEIQSCERADDRKWRHGEVIIISDGKVVKASMNDFYRFREMVCMIVWWCHGAIATSNFSNLE